jgi:hypothetical protein
MVSPEKRAGPDKNRGTNDNVDVARARRRVSLAITAGVVLLAVLGYAAFEFTGHVSGSSPDAIASPKAVPVRATVTSPAPATTRAPASTAPATTTAPQARGLIPVAAEAFGPNGTSDGDNPQLVANVLRDPAAGWMTDWYATAFFGQLKAGTGLLVDMGHDVTIMAVQVQLGGAVSSASGDSGADLQLRGGTRPDLSSMPVLTSQAGASGLVDLTLSTPVRARYVLLWFTKLPPDGSGTYQVFVHRVSVQGQP